MSQLSDRIQSLSEVEIRQTFDEIMEYNKKGFLGMDTLLRQIRDEFAKDLGVDSWDMGCTFTANEIMFEIAKRYYGLS